MEQSFSETSQAVRRLEELAFGAGFAAMLRAAVELGVPDVLADRPASVDDLAATLQVQPNVLNRLLRALTAHGVFTEEANGEFAHNTASRLLRKDAPLGLAHLVEWISAPWTWEAWQRLGDAVKTGESVIPQIYGKDFYTYLRDEAPEAQQTFNLAMTQVSALTSEKVARALDLDGVNVIADIAGGQGHLLRNVLGLHPGLRGILLELPAVTPHVHESLRAGGEFAARASIEAGNCIAEVPGGADLYVLKNLLDWPNENSISVLRNIAGAAAPGTRVVVVDSLLDADPAAGKVTAIKDLLLLLNVGGGMHTLDEFKMLFAKSGLTEPATVTAIPDTFPTLYLIEGSVAG